MKRVDGTLPSELRTDVCDGDPKLLAATMSTVEGSRALDEAVKLRRRKGGKSRPTGVNAVAVLKQLDEELTRLAMTGQVPEHDLYALRGPQP